MFQCMTILFSICTYYINLIFVITHYNVLSSILITLNPLINFCARVRMKTSLVVVDFAPAKAHSHIKQPQIL